MKITAILSRYTANRDIIEEDFGRQMRLFEQLQKHGHQLIMICADYKKHRNETLTMHGMKVISISFNWKFPIPFAVKCHKIIKKENPDLIIAATEPIWGILGCILAKSFRKPLLYDIHDNFKVYDSYKIPLMGIMERQVIKNAAVVTVVSENLKKDIGIKKAVVIENGYNEKLFRPMDKKKCRKQLKLPEKARIISYIGSIQKVQGTDILIKAAQELRKGMPELKLMLAGKTVTKNNQAVETMQEGVINLGSIPQEQVPAAINAADIMVIPYPKNAFTQYCSPYKIAEFMACEKPIVTTDVGTLKELAGKYVAKPGDRESLKQEIRKALKGPARIRYAKTKEYGWERIGKKLDSAVRGLA